MNGIRKARIEEDGEQIARIGERAKHWNGVHAPIEAERCRIEKQLEIEDGQVTEGEQTR